MNRGRGRGRDAAGRAPTPRGGGRGHIRGRGGRGGRARGRGPRQAPAQAMAPELPATPATTEAEMLRLGLQLVGFNDSRQRVRNSLSVDRFTTDG